MVDIWTIKIPQLTGEQERRAYIYLPNSYNNNPDKRYPVLYMFDGHNVFFDADATYGKSWGLKEYLDYNSTELIVAAVECNRNPDNGRLREYAPFSFESWGFGKVSGLGQITMEWFINVFKRDIDNRFRTLPDREHTFIAGSSMGGLMGLYAVIKYNHIFSRTAALSPAVGFCMEQMRQLIDNSILDTNTVIYMDCGSIEMNSYGGIRSDFASITAQLINKGVFVCSRIIPDGTHCEASWEKQIPFFMETLFYNLK